MIGVVYFSLSKERGIIKYVIKVQILYKFG
jgi:hypothetical protein